MPRKKAAADIVTELRKHLADKKLVIGRERTLKGLMLGKLAKVYVSANCPKAWKDDLKYYCSLSNTELNELSYPNEELGAICKKPFSISVIGVVG